MTTSACRPDAPAPRRSELAALPWPSGCAAARGRWRLAYDGAFGLLADAAARASLARSVHPDPALRAAAEACEQVVDAASTALALDPRLYAALARLDVAGEDAATRHLHQKTPARPAPGRRRPRRAHARRGWWRCARSW